MSQIHPSAIISEKAILGSDCTVGAYSVIGPRVVIGPGTWIGSHVVIEGITRIGKENKIFQFASIGAIPQDLKYHGEESSLEIGDRNIIREYVTLQPGTEGGGMRTTIGNSNLFMACSHVGHDCQIGNFNIVANSVAIAGHVTIGDGVTLGGLCGVHQFVRLGDYALLGAGAMVNKDVPPYCLAQGDRAKLAGINRVGLERRGFSAEDIRALKNLYREVFLTEGLWRERVEKAREYAKIPAAIKFLDFIASSERGVAPVRSLSESDEAH